MTGIVSTGPMIDCSPAEPAAMAAMASARRAVRSLMVFSIIDSGMSSKAPIKANKKHFCSKGFFMARLLVK